MNISIRFTICLLAAQGMAVNVARSADEVTFEKTVLDDQFRSEGVAVADINKDGKNDVVVGDLWYEAPKWVAHEIRKPREPKRGGYTEAFAVYSDDFNRDGWADVLVIPFHGNDAKWYENPKNEKTESDDGHWREFVAFKQTGNETRLYPDLFADEKPVFLMGVEGKIAWVEVPESPYGPWTVHDISDGKHKAADRFYHGLGIGDLSGDGRNDVLCGDGWWEQPAAGRKADGPWKWHDGPIANNCADMYVMDADKDGRADVLCTSAHGRGIWWKQQTGDKDAPKFESTTLDESIHETHSLNFVDINGDGRKDLVTGWRFFAHGFSPEKADMPSELAWFEIETIAGAAPKLVKHSVDDQSGVGAQFVTTDINGNGQTDIVVSNRKGVSVFEQRR